MKSSIIFILIALTFNCDGASFFPSEPDPLELSNFTTVIRIEVLGYEVDFKFSLLDGHVHRTSNLHDELSYNCLTNNFQFALSYSNTSLESGYNVVGYIGMSPDDLNLTGIAQVECNNQEGTNCLLVGQGQIIKYYEEPIMQNFETTRLFDGGPGSTFKIEILSGVYEGVPIEEIEIDDQLMESVELIAKMGVQQVASSQIHFYFNNVVLANKTMEQLYTMMNSECQSLERSTRGVILPELPDSILLPEKFVYQDESYYNISLNFFRKLSGLDDMEHEMSYNCLTNQFELGLLLKEFNFESSFHLEGTHENLSLNLTGVVKEPCDSSQVTDDGCLLIVRGEIKMSENGTVTAGDLSMSQLEYDYEILSGLVDGKPWDEDPAYWSIILSRMDGLRAPVQQDLLDTFQNYLSEVLAFSGGIRTEVKQVRQDGKDGRVNGFNFPT